MKVHLEIRTSEIKDLLGLSNFMGLYKKKQRKH